MPVRFVLDENLRGVLWSAIVSHNASGGDPIDAVRVGDLPDLPLGTQDPDLLAWAEREGRILVSLDVQSMIGHLMHHLAGGRHSPGLFLVRPGWSLSSIVGFLALVAADPDETQWEDQFAFIP